MSFEFPKHPVIDFTVGLLNGFKIADENIPMLIVVLCVSIIFVSINLFRCNSFLCKFMIFSKKRKQDIKHDVYQMMNKNINEFNESDYDKLEVDIKPNDITETEIESGTEPKQYVIVDVVEKDSNDIEIDISV